MRKSPFLFFALFAVFLITPPKVAGVNDAVRDRDIATAFAPIIYQALGDKPRSDYITAFNFDGDWRGDNNWKNADDEKFPLQAYVYYSVAETATHFFVHYAVFHPRDYKGGEIKGAILSELMREGARRGGKYDPTGMAEETSLAHENDMEGCLLVMEKKGNDPVNGRLKYVETFGHNSFSRYEIGTESAASQLLKVEDQRIALYIEPKGHGLGVFDDQKIEKKKFLVYRFTGQAEDPTKQNEGAVGYDLVSLQTLWNRAKSQKGNLTFGEFHNYGTLQINLARANGRPTARKISLALRGASFLGNVGGINMARPPWGWMERGNRAQRGLWFFDPATVIKKNFKLTEGFSTAYVRTPFWANAR